MDTTLGSNSTSKRWVPVRMAERVNPNVTKSDFKKNVRERMQPVKVSELIRDTCWKNPKKSQTSEKKKTRILPERLGWLCTEVKTVQPAKQHGSAKKAKRTLNFNQVEVTGPKSKALPEQKNVAREPINVKNVQGSRIARRSLYPAPEAKKDTHVGKACPVANRYSRIPQSFKSPKTGKVATQELNSTAKRRRSKAPGTCTTSVKRYTKDSKLSNKTATRGVEKTGTERPKERLRVEENHVGNLLRTSSIVDLGLIQEDDTEMKEVAGLFLPTPIPRITDVQRNIMKILNPGGGASDSSDLICINRGELVALQESIQNLVRRTEEDLGNLKSALSRVARLLNTPSSVPNSVTKTSVVKEAEKATRADKEVQVNECCNSAPLDRLSAPSPWAVSTVNHADDNKENTTPTITVSNDSFVEMENQLDIRHTRSLTETKPVVPVTPASKKVLNKSCRSLKEYIALKSSINFLKTPDTKRCRSMYNNDITKLSASQTQISNKLLADLQNLYADSPSSLS